MIPAKEIAHRLARDAERVATMLLPQGRREGREWVAGSVHGEEGRSLKVCLSGDKAGVWKDFASDNGGDLLDLWATVRGLGIAGAMRQARDFLGIAEPLFVTQTAREYRRPEKPKVALALKSTKVLDYLRSRGLTDEAIRTYRICANEADDEIVFPFLLPAIGDMELANVKYLALERPDGKKVVRQEKNAEPCLFGWQAIPADARSVVICEGELDAATWWQMGFPALSVWSGAGNLQWVEVEFERLSQFDTIYVAFDADDAGEKGAKAVIERLGADHCLLVTTPLKDANECLQKGYDATCFADIIAAAKSLDPRGLRSAAEYVDDVLRLMRPPEGQKAGFGTPFEKLHNKGAWFHPAELVIVNGINGHGKTKFLSQLALSLMRQGARCCMASMEIKPAMLLEAMDRQAAALADPSEPFVRYIHEYYDSRLWLFDAVGTVKADYLLDVFRYARKRYGVRCFFIDSLAKCGLAEDDYTGQKRFVEALCDFKNETDSTVFLVTHSRKLESELRVVDKMDIKGTGAIADLADTVTTLWRDKAKERKPELERQPTEPDAKWFWQKNRNGSFEGTAYLWFDQPTFQFLEHADARPKSYVVWARPVEWERPVEGVST